MHFDKSVLLSSSYEISPGVIVRITEHVNMEDEKYHIARMQHCPSENGATGLTDYVILDLPDDSRCDSGIGKSSFHSHPPFTQDSTDPSVAKPLQPSCTEIQERILDDFLRFCIECRQQCADPENYQSKSMWPTNIQMENWIGQLVNRLPKSDDTEKSAIDSFLNDLMLFAVRDGPDSLLSALFTLGLLLPGQQLANNFTALQTAVIWRNESALVKFGQTITESVISAFVDSIDVDSCRTCSPLDSVFLRTDDFENDLRPFYHDTPFTLQQTSVLVQLKTVTTSSQFWQSVFRSAVKNGQCTFCEMLIVLFGADVNWYDQQSKWTSLHIAAANGHLSLFELLLSYKANPNAVSSDNCLPEELCQGPIRQCLKFKEKIMPYRLERCQLIRDAIVSSRSLKPDTTAYDLTVNSGDEGPLIFCVLDQPQNEELMKRILQIPDAPINIQHPRTGQSLLIKAVSDKNVDILGILLDAGLCPSLRDLSGKSALDYAVSENRMDIIEIMVKYRSCWTGLPKALKDTKSADAADLLRDVLQKRQTEIVRPAIFAAATGATEFLDILESGDEVNITNSQKESPIFVAAKHGQLKALQVFVEYGGDITGRCESTMDTVLHAAARGGHADVIAFIAQFACKEKRTLCPDALNCVEQTAAYLAAEGGHAETLNTLLKLGASSSGYFRDGILLRSSYESVQAVLDVYRLPKQIAIFRSIEKGDLKTLKAVWTSKFDHYFRDHIGDTPLMVAAQSGHLKILNFLLESAEQQSRPLGDEVSTAQDEYVDRLSINNKRKDNKEFESRPFDLSGSNRQNSFQHLSGNTEQTTADCVLTIFRDNYMVNHVSAINVVDGCCAVHRAIEVGDNIAVVRLLTKKDPFCVNIQEHNGFTPLHLAVILRRRNIVKYLLQIPEVDLYATDLLGRLPEELAWSESTMRRIAEARTVMPDSWTNMCDQQIPMSTADGLSSWTRRFRSAGSEYTEHENGSDEENEVGRFAGKTSASQDGVQEYLDRKMEEKNRQHQLDRRILYQPYDNYDCSLPRIGYF